MARRRSKTKLLAEDVANHNESRIIEASGDNSRFIRHNLEISYLPTCNLTDVSSVENRTQEYFRICDRNDMKPSFVGLACALGVNKRSLWGLSHQEDPVGAYLQKVVTMLDAQMVDLMQNGKINPVAGIFLSKNFFGYTDKQEVEVTTEEKEEDPSKLYDKYMNNVVLDDGTVVVDDQKC